MTEGVDGLLRDKTRPPGKLPISAAVLLLARTRPADISRSVFRAGSAGAQSYVVWSISVPSRSVNTIRLQVADICNLWMTRLWIASDTATRVCGFIVRCAYGLVWQVTKAFS